MVKTVVCTRHSFKSFFQSLQQLTVSLNGFYMASKAFLCSILVYCCKTLDGIPNEGRGKIGQKQKFLFDGQIGFGVLKDKQKKVIFIAYVLMQYILKKI